MLSKERTEKALRDFANQVKDGTIVNISRKGMNTSGDLARSVDFALAVSPNSFSLAFLMASYGKFQDLGVRGFKSSAKAPDSPFRFGTGTAPKGLFKTFINAWVVRKGIAPRDERGRFLTRSQLNFLIRRSIFNTGLRPKKFFTEPFEDAFRELPRELSETYGLDLADFIKFTLEKANENVK